MSGMKAMGGIGRRKEKIGPRIAYASRLDPINSPIGTPAAIPSPSPVKVRKRLARMCSVSVFPAYPLIRRRRNSAQRFAGEGRTKEETRPLAVAKYHSRRMVAIVAQLINA